jgi:hypothetical protein
MARSEHQSRTVWRLSERELLVYGARKGPRTYTAISRSPYFTALAYWETVSPWTGGGFFVEDKTVVLGHKLAIHSLRPIPPGV